MIFLCSFKSPPSLLIRYSHTFFMIFVPQLCSSSLPFLILLSPYHYLPMLSLSSPFSLHTVLFPHRSVSSLIFLLTLFLIRYTCYRRQQNFVGWSYYTGASNGGVVAEVSEWKKERKGGGGGYNDG